VGEDAGFRAVIRGEMVRGAEGVQDTIAEHILPVFKVLSELYQQGVQRGHIRPDFPPALGVFFFIRLYIEILDTAPILALRIARIPIEQALPLAERSWFELYWRGLSTHPEDPLPFLDQPGAIPPQP
jgi:hypothetical protein